MADLEFLPEDQEDKDSLETTTRRQWLSVSPNLEEASEDEDEALDDYDYTDDDNDEEEDADQIDEEDQAVEEAAGKMEEGHIFLPLSTPSLLWCLTHKSSFIM